MMHTKILEKCLEELRKDDPRKDYVIGMLETLVEMDSPTAAAPVRVHEDPLSIPDFPVVDLGNKKLVDKKNDNLTDEEKEFAAKMRGPIANLG